MSANTLTLKEVPRDVTDLNIPYTWTQNDRVIRIQLALKKGEGIHGTVFVNGAMIFQYNRQTVENLSGELLHGIDASRSCSNRTDDNTVVIVIFKETEGQVWERVFKS